MLTQNLSNEWFKEIKSKFKDFEFSNFSGIDFLKFYFCKAN